MSNTYSCATLECPYCTHEIELTDWAPKPNQGEVRTECCKCSNLFWSEAEILYSSKMDCELNKIEHLWKPSWASDNWMYWNCTICGLEKSQKYEDQLLPEFKGLV